MTEPDYAARQFLAAARAASPSTARVVVAPVEPSRVSASLRRQALRKLLRSGTGLFGVVATCVFVLGAVFAPWIAPHDAYQQDLSRGLGAPFWMAGGDLTFPLGTDALGRDILSRLILGSQVSLLVGILSVLLGSLMGVTLGLVAGFRGGAADSLITRLGDVQLAFPQLLLAIIVMAVLGQGIANIVIVLAVTSWVQYMRIVRSRTLSLSRSDFVLAEHAIGASGSRIMFQHILPNVTGSIIVIASFAIPQVIVSEASLSFLGVGIPPPTPTWGNMVADGRDYVVTAWWLSVWPGIALMICLLGINLLGDWLRDVLDPRMKNL
jgi:peptide/nickel transport system permease protein